LGFRIAAAVEIRIPKMPHRLALIQQLEKNVPMESTDFWRAVALVRLDRPTGLAALESVFAAGATPTELGGPLRGSVVSSTLGHGLDPLVEALTSWWLPWKGKTFDPDAADGRNLFSQGARRLMRITLPKYQTVDQPHGYAGAFRFLTSTGPSAFVPGVEVLRIDYRDVPENPRWPVRRILDELVMIAHGRYLGQALLEYRGQLRRAAWFCLEADQAS
jgi:hypothetical protein